MDYGVRILRERNSGLEFEEKAIPFSSRILPHGEKLIKETATAASLSK